MNGAIRYMLAIMLISGVCIASCKTLSHEKQSAKTKDEEVADLKKEIEYLRSDAEIKLLEVKKAAIVRNIKGQQDYLEAKYQKGFTPDEAKRYAIEIASIDAEINLWIYEGAVDDLKAAKEKLEEKLKEVDYDGQKAQ